MRCAHAEFVAVLALPSVYDSVFKDYLPLQAAYVSRCTISVQGRPTEVRTATS